MGRRRGAGRRAALDGGVGRVPERPQREQGENAEDDVIEKCVAGLLHGSLDPLLIIHPKAAFVKLLLDLSEYDLKQG